MGFFSKKENTANTAKERLKFIITHERNQDENKINVFKEDVLHEMQADILNVVKKYYNIENDNISVKLDKGTKQSTLEVNVSLPE
jgi:cell division topological specificity factor